MKKETKIPVTPAVCNPERTQGLLVKPKKGTKRNLVSLRGPGIFISAAISKQGGDTDLTFINLDIDGRNVVSISYAALTNWGLSQHNSYGVYILPGKVGIDLIGIGFQVPLYYKKSLKLAVQVQEGNVVQIVSNVIHGTS